MRLAEKDSQQSKKCRGMSYDYGGGGGGGRENSDIRRRRDHRAGVGGTVEKGRNEGARSTSEKVASWECKAEDKANLGNGTERAGGKKKTYDKERRAVIYSARKHEENVQDLASKGSNDRDPRLRGRSDVAEGQKRKRNRATVPIQKGSYANRTKSGSCSQIKRAGPRRATGGRNRTIQMIHE